MKPNNITIILGLALLCLPFQLSYGQGARYTGSYSKSATIQHTGKSNLVIEGFDFSSKDGNHIALYNCENVIIRNNKFSSAPHKQAIYLDNCRNITIVDNSFENVGTGLRAHKSQSIKFEYNDILNLGAPLSSWDDSINGFMVLFDKVTGSGNSISYNVCENVWGESTPGDIINVNQSHGTAQSPIMVKGNWIRGGGPSPAGGGILIGDLGGSYQVVEDNILVDPGQYGIGIGGGNNMTLRNNKVYAKKQYFNNVAISACNWSEQMGQSHSITIENNAVNYTNKDGRTGESWWIYQNVEPVAGKSTNKYDPNLKASILPDKILGRARSTSTPPTTTPNGSTPLPEDKPTEQPTPTPTPTPPTNEPGNDTGGSTPGVPNVKNDPSIQIYLDSYNRVCVNVKGSLSPSAEIIGANGNMQVIYRQPLKRFHTVLPNRPTPGNYTIMVTNGSKSHMKTVYIP